MFTLSSLFSIVHFIGLALAVGAATVKLLVLLRSMKDVSFVPVFLAIEKPVTKQIIVGSVLLIASGVGWLFIESYPLTPRLVVKLVLVATILVLGPIIDHRISPKFRQSAPAAGEEPSNAFLDARKRYVNVEILATLLFYAIIVIWVA